MAENKILPGDLPLSIGIDVIDRLARYDRSNFAADYAIGNQPWLSAANDQNKISRVTTAYQKERVDQEASAGENSLSNWWLRSSTSWHRGNGITFYDADATDQHRFRESANVDIWTQGQVTLLKDTEEIVNSGATALETCSLGFWYINGSGALYIYKTSTSSSTAITGISGTVQKIVTDGSTVLVGTTVGIYQVDESTLTATKLYNCHGTSWTVQAIGYVKDRIIACVTVTDTFPYRVLELGRNPASPPVNVSLTTDSRYESKSSGLIFAGVTETTGAILVGFTTGNRSRVLSFTIDNSASGSAAMLEPIIVAEFPSGETLNELRGYLSTYVIAATTKGLRVADETSNGQGFTYGPITIPGNIADISFNGEYVYATRTDEFLGKKGLWRVHLGTPVNDTYAYASDLSIPAGTPVATTVLDTTGRMVIATSSKIYVEHATRLAEQGYIDSGYVRFGTTEYKQPVSFAIRSTGTAGTLGIRVNTADAKDSATFESIPLNQTLNIPVSASLLPDTEFEVRFTLSRSASDTTAGPKMEEWQLRALPAPLRSRTITLPLFCLDQETDANGVIRTSTAYERLFALEKLEQSGGACLFQDFTTGEERLCIISAIQYDQSTPPSFRNGFGGIVTIQLKTVDVEVI